MRREVKGGVSEEKGGCRRKGERTRDLNCAVLTIMLSFIVVQPQTRLPVTIMPVRFESLQYKGVTI